jgi:hypothetical protein
MSSTWPGKMRSSAREYFGFVVRLVYRWNFLSMIDWFER